MTRPSSVAGRAADGLNQAGLAAQEAFLVRVQNGHQTDLRHVQPLPQQVDAHQHVVLAQPQITDQLGALHGLNVAVQIAHPDAQISQVFGQAFGHALGQRGHQHPLALFDGLVNLAHQIIHLTRGGAQQQSAGPAAPWGG